MGTIDLVKRILPGTAADLPSCSLDGYCVHVGVAILMTNNQSLLDIWLPVCITIDHPGHSLSHA